MIPFYRYFAGFARYSFSSSVPERLLQVALRKNVPVFAIRRSGDREITLCVMLYRERHLKDFFANLRPGEGFRRESVGLPAFVFRHRKRAGFAAGAALTAAALALSVRFLWGVEVAGNSTIPDPVIREALAACGVEPGVRISEMDRMRAEADFLIANPEFSYVSVNVTGTLARVEVREREKQEDPVSYEGASNLVSSCGGRVVRYEVFSGQAAVRPGEDITEGQLLISGVAESKSGAFRTVRAAGRVFVETRREFEAWIPLTREERIYTGKERAQNAYSLLGFDLSFQKEDCPFAEYTESAEEERMTVFGLGLPVIRKSRVFRECVTVQSEINIDRAENLSYDRYETWKREVLPADTEILEEEVEVLREPDGVRLKAALRLVENAVREAPFEVTFQTP